MSSANPDPIRRGMQRAIRPMSYPTAIRAICRNRAVRYGARHRMCVALAIVQHPLFELSVIRYGLFRLVRIRRELRWRWAWRSPVALQGALLVTRLTHSAGSRRACAAPDHCATVPTCVSDTICLSRRATRKKREFPLSLLITACYWILKRCQDDMRRPANKCSRTNCAGFHILRKR